MDYTVTQAQLLAYLEAQGCRISRQTFSGSILPMMLETGHAIKLDTTNPKSRILASEAGKQAVLRYLRFRAEGGTRPGVKHSVKTYKNVTGA